MNNNMTVSQRIRMLRLLEKQKKNPELAEKLGINVIIKEKNNQNKSQNESIAVLLIEAAELLNESYGRNGAIRKALDAKIEALRRTSS